MRTNKFRLSLAVAGLLVAGNAAAESGGAFVGFQLGYGRVSAEIAYEATDRSYGASNFTGALSGSSFRYGFLVGYKQFFAQGFGLRYYGVFDYGTVSKRKIRFDTDEVMARQTYRVERDIIVWNLNANVDVLVNFISRKDLEFGAFGGLSLGYTGNRVDDSVDVDRWDISGRWQTLTYRTETASGGSFDCAANFGFRTNIAKHHSIELYSRFVVLKQKDGIEKQDWKSQHPYAVGLRYVSSF